MILLLQIFWCLTYSLKKKKTPSGLMGGGGGTPSLPQDFSLDQPLESVVFDERCPFLYPVTEIVMHN